MAVSAAYPRGAEHRSSSGRCCAPQCSPRWKAELRLLLLAHVAPVMGSMSWVFRVGEAGDPHDCALVSFPHGMDSQRLFRVSMMPLTVTLDELRSVFGECGVVENVRCDADGRGVRSAVRPSSSWNDVTLNVPCGH